MNGVAEENVYVAVASAISCSLEANLRAGAGLGINDRKTQSESQISRIPPDLRTRKGSLKPDAC